MQVSSKVQGPHTPRMMDRWSTWRRAQKSIASEPSMTAVVSNVTLLWSPEGLASSETCS